MQKKGKIGKLVILMADLTMLGDPTTVLKSHAEMNRGLKLLKEKYHSCYEY